MGFWEFCFMLRFQTRKKIIPYENAVLYGMEIRDKNETKTMKQDKT